jgi:tRNA A-37 threonylcarbamoyl transferase component Bud32
MLTRLHAAHLAVPEPIAHLELASGERVVATRFVAGEPLSQALRRPARERRALLAELGALVRRLHGSGVVHRDLHVGNLLVTSHGLLLLDLASALPLRGRRARLRDLGELDASLAPRLSHADRVRVASAAQGLARPHDARGRAKLRDVARAGLERARAHWRSRTRRSLRAGRQYAPLSLAQGRGLRLRDVPEARVAALLSGAVEAGARVQSFDARGAWSALLFALRGSPARRAWRAAAGLRARGVACERPLAYVERRRLGLPLRAWLVLETLPPIGAAEADVARLRAALRARDVQHPELRAALRRGPDGRLALGRLEAVRFARGRDDEAFACAPLRGARVRAAQRGEIVTQR